MASSPVYCEDLIWEAIMFGELCFEEVAQGLRIGGVGILSKDVDDADKRSVRLAVIIIKLYVKEK